MNESLLMLKQIARELGCSTDTVRHWYMPGKLDGAFQPAGKGSQLKMPKSKLDKIKEAK